MEDPITNSDGASTGDVSASNLEKDLQTLGIEPDVVEEAAPSQEEEVVDNAPLEKTAEQLRSERASAVTEAIKNSKEAKTARADADYYKAYAQVADDPDSVVNIYSKNAELAERIVQEKWGMSYDELISKAQEGDKESEAAYNPNQIDALIDKRLSQREQRAEQQRIEKTTIDFFTANDIDLKSSTFKDIMSDYSSYNVKSEAQSKRLLNMLYKEHTGETSVSSSNIDSVSIPRVSGRKTYSKSSKYKDALNTAKSLGMNLSEEDFKKYSK